MSSQSRPAPRKFNKAKRKTFSIAGVVINPLTYFGLVALISALFFISKKTSITEDFCLTASLSSCSPKEQELFFKQTEENLPEAQQSLVINSNTFKEAVPVMVFEGQSRGSMAEPGENKEALEYTVEKGDTLSSIAEKFGISLETILWANDLNKNSKIAPGQKLIILPVSGLTHLVGKGETVSELAALYKTEASEIISFNELSDRAEVFAGDILIIPGGKMPVKQSVATYSVPLASNYFICPIPAPCNITQGLHWYNAIDFSNGGCGESVFAAAGGTVQRTGYHSVAGRYVRILHPNGVVTFYGHLSATLVSPGEKVSQGELIGYVGNTGYTVGVTGCHLHFEVRGAENPFAK